MHITAVIDYTKFLKFYRRFTIKTTCYVAELKAPGDATGDARTLHLLTTLPCVCTPTAGIPANHHLPRSKRLGTRLAKHNITAGVWIQQSINKPKPISSNIDCLISIFSRHDIFQHRGTSVHSRFCENKHKSPLMKQTKFASRNPLVDWFASVAAEVAATNC